MRYQSRFFQFRSEDTPWQGYCRARLTARGQEQ